MRPPRSAAGEHPPAPAAAALTALLDAYAPLAPAPLCPEIGVFQALSLLEIWQAAEDVAGRPLPAPFWAYAWAGGSALARVLLDEPERVRGRRVLDLGCGGGVASLAAAWAGAVDVVANDVDPWALATLTLAAARQDLTVRPLCADLTRGRARMPPVDVVLCGDLCYERAQAGLQRAVLRRYSEAGASVLVADAERAYFTASGLRPLRRFRVAVPRDLEGTDERTARVYEMA